jgi:hypothetical protein
MFYSEEQNSWPLRWVALTPQPPLPNWERGSRRSDGGEGRELNRFAFRYRVAAEPYSG